MGKKLSEILEEENADEVSAIKGNFLVGHVKGLLANWDVEVLEGETYFVRKGKDLEEKKL